ncbi:MAG: ribonuclease H-like domain-containing protein [Deltaproteobacteria bacterium]|nr:ribonuclease H-like domain-containing protein [Deltaproteobacteria bacterium]
MLKNTFCHLPGVGIKSETRLWEGGIFSWDDMLGASAPPDKRPGRLAANIRASYKHLEAKDPAYFASLLPEALYWRLFPEFASTTAYIDIETNGIMGEKGYITAIALYDGKSVHNYVNGYNLDEFAGDIKKYNLIVTYNGKCFDIPFIESHMNVRLPQAHIDLRFALKSLGFTGGLKGCEKKFGIDRGGLEGLDGFFAVLLWNDFLRNRNGLALETLIAYNSQDAVSLEPLLVHTFNLKLRGTPFFSSGRLPLPPPPDLPFTPHMDTIERISRERYGHYRL